EVLRVPPGDRPGLPRPVVSPKERRGRRLDGERLVAQIREEEKRSAALHRPGDFDGAPGQKAVAAWAKAQRRDFVPATGEERAIELDPCLALRALRLFPVKRGSPESGLGVGIGDALPCRGIAERAEACELPAPAVPHRLAELALEVAEVEEWPRAAPLLAHEEQGRRRREEEDRDRGPEGLLPCKRRQAFSERPVADLVVVLQEVDERRGREMGAGLAARFARERRHLALVGEALREAAREGRRGRVGVGGGVAVGLAGGEHVEGMVRIVVPLRGVSAGP